MSGTSGETRISWPAGRADIEAVIDIETEQILKKWNDWLDRIYNEISQLYENRRIYRDLIEIIETNPRINGGNWLYVWMFGNYAQVASSTIRRLLELPDDPHKRKKSTSISLALLIDDVCKHPELIRREDFLSRCNPHLADLVQKSFDRLAGPAGTCLDPKILDGELSQTRCTCRKVQKYVDKVIAHHDGKPPILPTYKDVSDAIDAVGELFEMVYYALTGNSIANLEPVLVHEWKWVLDEPWVGRRKLRTGDYPHWSQWISLGECEATAIPDSVFSVVRIRIVGQDGKPHEAEHHAGIDHEGIVLIGRSGFDTKMSKRSGLRTYIRALVASLSDPDADSADWEGPRRLRSLWPRLKQSIPDASLQVQYIPLIWPGQAKAIEMRVRTEYREKFGREPEEAWGLPACLPVDGN